MTITEAVAEVYLLSTGKTTTIAAGTSRFKRIIGLLDYYQQAFSREPGIDWNSLYTPNFSLGPVTATDTYDLDTSTIRKISDREGDAIRIMWTDGKGYTDYDIVPVDALKVYYSGQNKENPIGFYVARQGSQLIFNHKFTSTDPQFGGDIQVPCYTFADDITSSNPDTEEVQVDNPSWLTTRAAAEYCRNDITRRVRWPELLTASNDLMNRMKDDDDAEVDDVTKPWTPFSGMNNGAW